MRHVQFWLRVVATAIAVVATALAFVVSSGEAQAEYPEPCGWVGFGAEEGEPTSTHTVVTYCDRPCGGGMGAGQPYTSVGPVEGEAFVCVRHV